jgi:2-haloalkanoic acid dehalogenase type II
MPARVKAITLDLDDTLWPIDEVMARAEGILHEWFECYAPRVAAALPPPEFAAYRRALALELPAIGHDFTMLRREALHRALQQHDEDVSLVDSAMTVFLGARNDVRFYPDALEALERLSRHYPVVSLSNGNADLAQIGIGHHFRATVSARGFGVAKPDPRIFHAACAEIDLCPEEVLHVGDDPDLDVRGGIGAGVRTVWMNRTRRTWVGEPVETLEMHDLLALCEWLGV